MGTKIVASSTCFPPPGRTEREGKEGVKDGRMEGWKEGDERKERETIFGTHAGFCFLSFSLFSSLLFSSVSCLGCLDLCLLVYSLRNEEGGKGDGGGGGRRGRGRKGKGVLGVGGGEIYSI